MNKMDKVLKQIDNGEFDFTPKPKIKRRFEPYPRDLVKKDEERKQQWYRIGKVIVEGHEVKNYIRKVNWQRNELIFITTAKETGLDLHQDNLEK